MLNPNSATNRATAGLTLAALGVVYGDIGTSPLYAMKVAFSGSHALPLSAGNVIAVLSMVFWAVTLTVSLKYLTFMLRYDHRGEGGVLALLTFAIRASKGQKRVAAIVTVLGILAASLFYGDAIITPAISVLSAVEGLSVATSQFEPWIVPIAVVLLTGLFMMQRRGTGRIGRVFGPIMVLWFTVLALLGLKSIMQTPAVLVALNPIHAFNFAIHQPAMTMLALGAVFLCLTGAEALYADMGHFGKIPIRIAWYGLVFPSLMLNYFGQGALLIRDSAATRNPFFLLAPEWLLLPLVALATCATIIASQATISAAYSVSQQASRLDFLPRLRILHTSDTREGQIYVPLVNWLMFAGVIGLVLGFGSSDKLAGAYGIAVNGDMIITSVLLGVVLILSPRRKLVAISALVVFLAIEAAYLVANIPKIPYGGWFPLVLAASLFMVLSTFRRGVELLQARKNVQPEARADNIKAALGSALRIPRTGIFFSSRRSGYPSAFLHNLKHNMVVHEKTIFLAVEFLDIPYVTDEDERIDIERLEPGTWRVTARFGFREDPDIAKIMRQSDKCGLKIDLETTSFFTSKAEVVSVTRPKWHTLRRGLFIWMLQNSPTIADYIRLPPDRVVELRTQVGV